MPTWKVLLICLFSGVCLALGAATVLVPMSLEGRQMWLWLGILLPSTAVACVLLGLFLRHAGRSM